MVATLRLHVCISVARRLMAVWRTMRGGMGTQMTADTSPFHPACGPGAACSHSFAAASHGWSGPSPRIMAGRARVCGPQPSSGMAGEPLCGGLRGAAGGALPAPFARPLLAHYTRHP